MTLGRRILPLALAAVGCSGTIAPPSGSCDTDPPPTFACDGDVLVATQCSGGYEPSATRTDCTASGEVCVQSDGHAASCVAPCDSYLDCAAGQYCSSRVTAKDTRGTCQPEAGQDEDCDPTSPRSCTPGLSCERMLVPAGDGGRSSSGPAWFCR
jgi:hypothetical protein